MLSGSEGRRVVSLGEDRAQLVELPTISSGPAGATDINSAAEESDPTLAGAEEAGPAPQVSCVARYRLVVGTLIVVLVAVFVIVAILDFGGFATGALPEQLASECSCRQAWPLAAQLRPLGDGSDPLDPVELFHSLPELPPLQERNGRCAQTSAHGNPQAGDTSATPWIADPALRIGAQDTLELTSQKYLMEHDSYVVAPPVALAAWSEVVVLQSALTFEGSGFDGSSFTDWIANCTVNASLSLASLTFPASTTAFEQRVVVDISVPVRASVVRQVMVSTPVSPSRRVGMFPDPVVSVGANGFFTTERVGLGGSTNRTLALALEIPIPSLQALARALAANRVAAGLLGDGRIPAAIASLSVDTIISSAQGQSTSLQGRTIAGTSLMCWQYSEIAIAAVSLGSPGSSEVFVTDSAFDFRQIATVTRAGVVDPVSNANMINLLRENRVNSLVYPDLLPRPQLVLTDDRAAVAVANVSAWARMMVSASTPDLPIPGDIPLGFQQPVRSPGPQPLAAKAIPSPVPLPLAGVKEFGFPVPEGAQRWFGIGNTLPSAQTTFRFVFESYHENVPVFAGPPYNGTLNPAFERMFRLILQEEAAQINTEAPGLLTRSHALLIDEADFSQLETRRNWVALASLYREVLPQVRLWQTAAAANVLALSDTEIALAATWVINSPTPEDLRLLNARIDAAMRNESNRGLPRPRTILYDNGVPALDMPLLRQRLSQWGAWLSNNPISEFNNTASRGAGVIGTLSYYTVAAWGPVAQTISVWDDPSVQDPVHRRPGWGLLVYPPEGGSPAEPITAGGPGDPVVPVTSLRMMAMRSGLQDVEVLRQLASAVSNASSACPPSSCLYRARMYGKRLLATDLPAVSSWIPLEWAKTWRDSFANKSYTTDPELVSSFRRGALSVIASMPLPSRYRL